MGILKNYRRKLLSFTLCFVLLMSTVTPALAEELSSVKTPSESDYKTSTDWIWSSTETVKHNTSYFRKEVTLASAPTMLRVETSAHNHLKYYVNGNLITGYVSPANASLPENVNYLAYEWEGAELDALLNSDQTQLCLAAAVQYMGENSTNYVTGKPAFWTEVTVMYENGDTEVFKSDTTWRASSNPPYATTQVMFAKRGIGTQIDYDARKMPDGLAWTRFGFAEADYPEITWNDAVTANEDTKTWKMRLQNIPEGAIHKELTPTAIGKQEVGYQVFDANQLVTGWVKIRASAPAGTRIYIRYSEYLKSDGTVHHGVGSTSQTTENYRDFYTFSGNGIETFVADFDYKAFRYFEIVGLTDWISVEDITVQWASSDLTQVSTFTSSDDMLNKLYEACINTQINNTIGMTVDCPHREQAQYLADSQLQYALFSYAFEEAPEFMYKTLFDFATQQLANGRFVYTSPTTSYTSIPSIPEWDLRYTAILQRYYHITGDAATVAEFYDNACDNVNYHYAMVDGIGLLIDDPAGNNISDHPGKAVPDDPGTGNHPTAANLLLYQSLNHLAEFATLLEKQAEAKAWKEKADALRTSINAYLKDSETGLYKHHSGTTETNTGLTAMAINTGAAESADLQRQLDAIANVSIEDTSIVLTYELFCAIMTYGNTTHKEYLYERMAKSWGPMVEKGNKTTWERFEDMSSHSHAWSAYPAYIMLKDFAGIDFTGTAYSDITVKPFLPSGVSHLSSTINIPDSDQSITVRLEQNDGYKLVVKPPKGESITVAVPRAEGGVTQVTANGKTVFADGEGKSISGITYLSNDAEYIYFKTTANKTYTFQSTVASASSAEAVALSISADLGGSVLLNGEVISLPYSETFAAGTQITLKATPDQGFAFIGWCGSLGATTAEITLTPDSNLTLKASFEERKVLEFRTVTITGPADAGWSVSYEGTAFTLPTSLNVQAGTQMTLTLVEPELSSHSFVSWSGASDSTDKEITLAVNENLTLSAIGSIKTGGEPTNLALGKTVTAATANATTWAAANLTDGNQGKVTGAYGLSSVALTDSTLPHSISIDLGETVSFNKVVIYPRTDYVDPSGELSGFPTSYYLETSTDNTTWSKVYSVENAAIPLATDGAINISFDSTNARYFRFVTVTPGNPDNKGSSKYTQFYELEIYNTNPPESVSLTVAGSGSVLVDGVKHALPYSGEFNGGSMVTLEPVIPEGFAFSGWTGDLTSSDHRLRVTLNSNCAITANFIDTAAQNLALGASVTSSNGTANSTTWQAANLTDGNQGRVTGSYGISSNSITEVPHYITIDFGTVTEFNRVVIFPRVDISYGDTGEVTGFPVSWSLQVSDDNSTWTTIHSVVDGELPQVADATVTVTLANSVSGRYLRFVSEKLGHPDDKSSLYYIQLHEIEVYMDSAVTATHLASDENAEAQSTLLSMVSADSMKNEVLTIAEKSAAQTISFGYAVALALILCASGLLAGILLKKKGSFQ